jgi:hypothetical protein
MDETRVSTTASGNTRLSNSCTARSDDLPVQTEPRRRWLDPVGRRVVEHGQPPLHLPPIPWADRAIDHGKIPFPGVVSSHPLRGPIPKEILQLALLITMIWSRYPPSTISEMAARRGATSCA